MRSNVVEVDFRHPSVIGPKLSLSPKQQDIHELAVPETRKMDHLTEAQLDQMVQFCLDNLRWRDAMLLVVGVNTGLRASDLCRVKVSDIMKGLNTGSFRMLEQKKTQLGEDKKRHYSPVVCYVNQPIREMFDVFMAMEPDMTSESYLFENRSPSKSKAFRKGVYTAPYPHINRQRVYLIVHGLYEQCGFSGEKCGSHSLRKTAPTIMQYSDSLPDNAPMKNPYGLLMAQLFLNHASSKSTLSYLNEYEETRKACAMSLTLGLQPALAFKKEQNIGTWRWPAE